MPKEKVSNEILEMQAIGFYHALLALEVFIATKHFQLALVPSSAIFYYYYYKMTQFFFHSNIAL